MKKNIKKPLIIGIAGVLVITGITACDTNTVTDEQVESVEISEVAELSTEENADKETEEITVVTSTEVSETEKKEETVSEKASTETSGTKANASTSTSAPVSVPASSPAQAPAEERIVSVPSTAAVTEPSTECVHDWVAVYREEGHYEEVMIAPEYQNPICESHTCCQHCEFDYTANGLHPGAGVHICSDGTTGAGYGSRKVIVGYETVPALYDTQWVTEQVLDYYKCSKCGAVK